MVKMQILAASLNKGFSFIEIIVTLLIISLVGSSFYIFFQNSNIPISLNTEIRNFQDFANYTGNQINVYKDKYVIVYQNNYEVVKKVIEVVVSLLILSITFTAFSLLLDQNLKAQLQKEKYVYKTTKEINLLTLYSNKSSTNDVSLKKFLGVKKEREKILSSFGIRREIEIIFIDGDKEIKIKIIR